jgi:hypothetical protein
MKVRYVKCLECGKRTMNFELGDVFYRVDDKSSTKGEKDVLVKDPIVCPKCKKDISDGKFEISSSNFFSHYDYRRDLPIWTIERS